MQAFIATYAQLPGELQCRAFLNRNAVRLALENTRQARLESRNYALWHDDTHRSSTPVLDLCELQRADAHGQLSSRHWQDLHEQMKPRALGFLHSEGVPDADAEDVFAEAMMGLVQVRKSGTAAIQDLLVYEQVPALFLDIVRKRLSNYLRHRHAEKRAVTRTVSLHGEDDAVDTTERSAFTSWTADEADPFSGLTFVRLAEECAHGLSSLQQRILAVLYIEESASYMEVASAPWFMQAAGIKPGTSDATRRRALDREHDAALDHLAQRLGIVRRSGAGKEN